MQDIHVHNKFLSIDNYYYIYTAYTDKNKIMGDFFSAVWASDTSCITGRACICKGRGIKNKKCTD